MRLCVGRSSIATFSLLFSFDESVIRASGRGRSASVSRRRLSSLLEVLSPPLSVSVRFSAPVFLFAGYLLDLRFTPAASYGSPEAS